MTVLNQQIAAQKASYNLRINLVKDLMAKFQMLINVKDKKDDPQGLQQDLQSVYKDIKDKKS